MCRLPLGVEEAMSEDLEEVTECPESEVEATGWVVEVEETDSDLLAQRI